MIKKVIFIFLLAISITCYFILQKNGNSLFDEEQRRFSDLQDREIVEIVFNSNKELEALQIAEATDAEELLTAIPEERILTVEVVNTAHSTTQGLSGRSEIGAEGMLFIFPTSENRYFWMKDMQFDLDMIWINNNIVVAISKNVPKPPQDTPDNRLETYSPNQDADMVLEVNAGDAEKFNIQPGDVVQLVQ